MVSKATKLRWRRRFRRSKHQVENVSLQAEEGIEKHFFKRLTRLGDVKRFVFAWVMLVVLLGAAAIMQVRALSPYYQTLQPIAGGIYTEGIIGKFTTANPLYATGSVDSTVSTLVFASLMKFNAQNKLVGDLADKVTTDERNTVFTVVLKDDITWHDGKPVTADDVVFTYQAIQNPDAKSPLLPNFKSIKIEKVDTKTVTFTSPHPLSSFPQLLTNGILPKHKLDTVAASQLRNVEFNTVAPVGSGPFKWDSIQISGQTPESREEQIGLSAFDNYHGGKPNLDTFIVKAVRDEQNLVNQFNNQQVDAMVGLDKRSPDLPQDTSISEYEFPLNAEIMIFLKASNDVLKDTAVRQALVKGTDRAEIIRGLGYAVIPVQSPLLQSHVGYDKSIVQFGYDKQAAEKQLDEAGWVRGADGMRAKGDTKLSFVLYSRNNSEYAYVTQIVQRQWRDLGVDLKVSLQEDSELQSTIALHNYDALLYGITVGSDPDVYAYWHSSQADVRAQSRLNLSELNSKTVDTALEAGRTRSDPELRIPKYKPFLTSWRDEAPAIGLYQPRFLYITRGPVYGLQAGTLNVATDRFASVQNWRVRTDKVTIE